MLRKPKTTDMPADLSLPQITPELLIELVSGPMARIISATAPAPR